MALQLPVRAETRKMLELLASGAISPEAASEWANQWILSDEVPEGYDPPVWRALAQLSGADLEEAPGELLHVDVDHRAWLEEFDRAVSPTFNT